MSSTTRHEQPQLAVEDGRAQGGAAPLGQARPESPSAETAALRTDVQAADVQAAPYFGWAMYWQWPLSLLMLICFAPVMVLIAILIRITSPGPAIYRQTRLGLNGKPFTLYKFRSMHLDAESGTGAVWAKPSDPRVTLLGKITRNLHLDELPQLFNVIRGEMSLVGPRPERPEFTAKIEKHVPDFHLRLLIRPGITGLAQVHQGPDVDMDSVRRKLVYDLEYVRRGNPGLDWRIMVCTLLRATEFTRTTGIKLLAIPAPSTDPPRPQAMPAPPNSVPMQGPHGQNGKSHTNGHVSGQANGHANSPSSANGQPHLNGQSSEGVLPAVEVGADVDAKANADAASSHTVARAR